MDDKTLARADFARVEGYSLQGCDGSITPALGLYVDRENGRFSHVLTAYGGIVKLHYIYALRCPDGKYSAGFHRQFDSEAAWLAYVREEYSAEKFAEIRFKEKLPEILRRCAKLLLDDPSKAESIISIEEFRGLSEVRLFFLDKKLAEHNY